MRGLTGVGGGEECEANINTSNKPYAVSLRDDCCYRTDGSSSSVKWAFGMNHDPLRRHSKSIKWSFSISEYSRRPNLNTRRRSLTRAALVVYLSDQNTFLKCRQFPVSSSWSDSLKEINTVGTVAFHIPFSVVIANQPTAVRDIFQIIDIYISFELLHTSPESVLVRRFFLIFFKKLCKWCNRPRRSAIAPADNQTWRMTRTAPLEL